jgi:hypothetical protein
MNNKSLFATLWSALAAVVAIAWTIPQAKPYIETVFTAVGGLGVIATALAILPGKVGAFFAALGHDVDKVESLKPTDAAKAVGPVATLLFVVGGVASVVSACTPAQAVVAEQVVADVAGLACTEMDKLWQTEPGWVKFICTGVKVLNGTSITVNEVVKVPETSAVDFRTKYVKAGAK